MGLVKKGKILKIKQGYNPNCSSGMWGLVLYFIAFFGSIVTVVVSILISIFVYRNHISKFKKLDEINPQKISVEHESEI